MKKLLLLLLAIMFLPIGVFAKEKVDIYFFRGDGCPHCEAFSNYINRLDGYKDKIELHDYEVWNDKENDEMMQKIAVMRKEKNGAEGVPYIIIGNKSWFGYSKDMNSQIEAQIDRVYEQDVLQRYDVMKEYQKNKNDIGLEDDEDYIEPDEDSYYDDYYCDCEEEGYVDEDTMIGAAILAFLGGLAVAGIPLLIVIVVLVVVLIKKKRNG